jgi:uncharacterized protein YbcC (UPF0753/DUF2309 family)
MKPVETFLSITQPSTDAAIEAACSAVAPTWPLDRFIAVNPYWGWVDHHFDDAASRLGQLSGTTMLMPRAFYRDAWQAKSFDRSHLMQALEEYGCAADVQGAIATLDESRPIPRALPLLSDVLDESRDLTRAPAWRDTITHEISQFCAAYFDDYQADWHLAHQTTLFANWRDTVSRDLGIALLMKAPDVTARAMQLPTDARQAIEFVVGHLDISSGKLNDFLTAILLRVNGWAAWSAYQRWQARLDGRDDVHIVELLAIRLSWEFLLDDDKRNADSVWSAWQNALMREPAPQTGPDYDAVFQRALEIAYQTKLANDLANGKSSKAADSGAAPSVQAVFCIDVRSEVFRRALETVSPDVQTMGFAGFFGLPISYVPLGTGAERPQLPGLLAPAFCVTESCGNAEADRVLAEARHRVLANKKSSRAFQRVPGSAFTLVETLGLGYLAKLIKRALPIAKDTTSPDHLGAAFPADTRPMLRLTGDSALEQKVSIAERVLKVMSLHSMAARIVMLAGHGSQSANNPHAAGLDCGACCGQTGEVNARALALLLNDPDVRDGLAQRGRNLPATTHFLAALHNTTTDEVQLFDTDLVPQSHANDLVILQRKLQEAGALARAERATSLGLGHLTGQPEALMRAVKIRANDWSQTRPEWGLANNAAFIVGPRARTREIKLLGRSFLHDYDCKADTDGSVLELIMTAPMIVTHWINMQYYASTVDNLRYGSGNKVLHNVVGGRNGVFEGNGGDLRIGLPMQSLHDGEKWMHTPLRLSVFIEAPRGGIEHVVAKHELVRHLIDHNWLYLFRIDPDTAEVERYLNSEWMIGAYASSHTGPARD